MKGEERMKRVRITHFFHFFEGRIADDAAATFRSRRLGLLFAHNAKSQSRGERVPFGRVRVCRPVDDDPTRHVDIAEEG